MPEAPALNKKNKLKKISKEMFSWTKENICDGLVVYKSDNVEIGAILVSIPKKAIGSSVKRNHLRRVVKEIYRKSIDGPSSKHFLVKFNADLVGFEKILENYFKNV